MRRRGWRIDFLLDLKIPFFREKRKKNRDEQFFPPPLLIGNNEIKDGNDLTLKEGSTGDNKPRKR